MASRINRHAKILLLTASCALGSFFATGHSSDAFQQAQRQEKAADPHAAIRANNLGAAYLNQQRMEQALAQFKQAQAADPKLPAARVNEAIALLNLQRIEPARALLSEIVERDPKSIRAWYNLGLLEKNSGDAEKALAAFEKAAALDPDDADTHYFIGTLHSQLQQYDAAIAAFQRAIQLNPFHVSAEFGLARAQQRKGNSDQARLHLARFQHLNTEKLGAPMSLAYGDQGPYSLAETVTLPPSAAPPPIPVKFTPILAKDLGINLDWLDQRKLEEIRQGKLTSWMSSPAEAWDVCLIDYDNDGRLDLFLLANEADRGGRLFRNAGSQFADVTVQAGLKDMAVTHNCAVADYDNDGWPDLAVDENFRVRLYRNTGNGGFKPVESVPCVEANRSVASLLFVDYDHDGDLDLYISNPDVKPAAGNVLCRNNGDGTFTDWTEPTGLAAEEPSDQALLSDLNDDRAVDFLIRTGKHSIIAYLNPREGVFKPNRPVVTNDAHQALTLDFDRDGLMDVAIGSEHGVTLWRNSGNKAFERVLLPETQFLFVSSIASLDYDNDGWQDVLITGLDRGNPKPGEVFTAENLEKIRYTVLLFRNNGAFGFRNVTREVGFSAFQPDYFATSSLAAGDLDGDGDLDALLIQVGSDTSPAVLLRNDGGNKNNWLKLSLKGLADNKSAIGTKVEVFAGASYQKFEITTPNDLLIGLGQEKQADVVRLLWPTGVLQDEVNLAANQRHEIAQIDRRGSSCPVLFAWNGSRYEFIADAIGPGIVGHWVAPGLRNTSDPTEYIMIPGSLLRERRGANGERLLSFRFAEPMEEIVYLDQLRLFAIDHPSDTDVNPSERFYASGPPFPTGEPVLTQRTNARPPVTARDHRGRDVTELLRERDRRYASDFADAPYKGFAELHWIEFDLGEAAQTTAQDPVGAPLAAPLKAAHPRDFGVRRLDAALFSRHERKDGNSKSLASASELAMTGRDDARLQTNGAQRAAPLRLLLHGYTDYFTATSVYAAHQGGVTAIVPYVEALTPAGEWVRVVNDMGFPAGLARTMVVDLTGKLPPGTRRIRIATNLKIYWDQILIDTTPDGTPHRISEAPLAGARAGYLGYPREIRGTPASDIRYDYHTVSATGPYARAAGHYTRYGDVRALVAGADDRFVLMGSGDEVAVEFDAAALPPVPEGWTRDWFFYVDGFAKDMDFYAAHPFTVTPLPYHAMPGYPYSSDHNYPNRGAHLEDQLEVNTRAVSGRPAPSYRYQYRKPRESTPAPPRPR